MVVMYQIQLKLQKKMLDGMTDAESEPAEEEANEEEETVAEEETVQSDET